MYNTGASSHKLILFGCIDVFAKERHITYNRVTYAHDLSMVQWLKWCSVPTMNCQASDVVPFFSGITEMLFTCDICSDCRIAFVQTVCR